MVGLQFMIRVNQVTGGSAGRGESPAGGGDGLSVITSSSMDADSHYQTGSVFSRRVKLLPPPPAANS